MDFILKMTGHQIDLIAPGDWLVPRDPSLACQQTIGVYYIPHHCLSINIHRCFYSVGSQPALFSVACYHFSMKDHHFPMEINRKLSFIIKFIIVLGTKSIVFEYKIHHC